MSAQAHYRFEAQIISRLDDRSSVACAAYRSASLLFDKCSGETHDYTRKGGVVHEEILLPDGAPSWTSDRQQLWSAVELAEKRKDAQVARELLLSLPHQLTHEQRLELVRRFIGEQFVAKGMIADIAVHLPHRNGDHRNHHAHVMLTMRSIDGEGFGKKDRSWNDRALLQEWREKWAEYQNVLFRELDLPLHADHRSLDDRGLNREPEPKLGPAATALDREGKKTFRTEWRKAVRDRNAERQQLEHEAKVIDLELKRKEADERAKHRAASALDRTRSTIRKLEEFDRGHEVINHYTREITRALSSARKLEHRQKYAASLTRGVESNFLDIFGEGHGKAYAKFSHDIVSFGITQATRMLRYDPRRYGHLPGWSIGNLYRSKERRKALEKVTRTAELSRQAFYMNKKVAGERVNREAMEQRVKQLKAEQKEAFKTPPEGRLLIQRLIDRAAYRLRREDWRKLSGREKYHLMQAREMMRDAQIRRWADERLAPYLDRLGATPAPRPDISMEKDAIDLKKISTAYHRENLEEREQALQKRHGAESNVMKARHREQERAVHAKRHRNSFIRILANTPGIGDLIERHNLKQDARRHFDQAAEDKTLRSRHLEEARNLTQERKGLEDRERKQGIGQSRSRSKATGDTERIVRRDEKSLEFIETADELTRRKSWKKKSDDDRTKRRKKGRGYGYRRPGPKGGGDEP